MDEDTDDQGRLDTKEQRRKEDDRENEELLFAYFPQEAPFLCRTTHKAHGKEHSLREESEHVGCSCILQYTSHLACATCSACTLQLKLPHEHYTHPLLRTNYTVIPTSAYLDINQIDDRHGHDSSKHALGEELKEWGQRKERDADNERSNDGANRRLGADGRVDSGAAEASGDGISLEERAENIADANGHQLAVRVNTVAVLFANHLL